MEYTEQNIRELFSNYRDISNRIESLFYKWNKITNEVANDVRFQSWEIEDDEEISIRWDVSWQYGGYDSGCIGIPISYLWDEEWEDKLRSKVEAERLAKEQQKIEQRRVEALKKEQAERELFEKLKTKFGEE